MDLGQDKVVAEIISRLRAGRAGAGGVKKGHLVFGITADKVVEAAKRSIETVGR
jgi:hypothetical protein